MTPAAILASVLKGRETDCGIIGRTLGIPRASVRRAAHGARGRPTRADHHMMLCAFLGFDPVTGGYIPDGAGTRIRFDATLFAMAVKMRRFERKQTAARAAKAARLSGTVYSRIVNAHPTSFESLLRAARAAGLDPRDYVLPVSREAVTRKPLIENGNIASASPTANEGRGG